MMYKIVISLCAFLSLSSCSFNRTSHSRYLTPAQFLVDSNFTERFVDCFNSTDGDNIYRYTIPRLNSSLPDIKFNDFKGKVILLINTATYCRGTVEFPQYNKLLEQFADKLEIVAFPCNQFKGEEPARSSEELLNAIKYVRPGNGFVPKFLITQKIEVNGPNNHPIYSYLKRSCPSTRTGFMPNEYLLYDPKNSRDIKWNYEKFLINPKTGEAFRRYDTLYDLSKIADDIKQLV